MNATTFDVQTEHFVISQLNCCESDSVSLSHDEPEVQNMVQTNDRRREVTQIQMF